MTHWCGLMPVMSFSEVEVAFSFDLEGGVLAFYSEDLLNRLFLDFGEESGEELLEVEWSGVAWGGVEY